MDTAIASSLVNFTLVVGILVYTMRKPLFAFLSSRSDSIRDLIAEAEVLAKESKLAHDHWSFQLKQSGNEIEKLKTDVAALIVTEKEKSSQYAARETNRISQETTRVSTTEAVRVKKSLEHEIAAASVELARSFLVENLKGDASATLFSEALERVRDGRGR